MEKGEEGAQSAYQQVSGQLDKVEDIVRDEYRHEKQLLELIDEERLHYIGSIVLGLNDALVKLTGALAGFTFALRDPRLVALTGLVTGTTASLSMGLLSTSPQNPRERRRRRPRPPPTLRPHM